MRIVYFKSRTDKGCLMSERQVYQCPNKDTQIPTDLSVGRDNAASAYVLCPLYSFIISISSGGWTEWRQLSQWIKPWRNPIFREDLVKGFLPWNQVDSVMEEPGDQS